MVNSSWWARIFVATCSGVPTSRWPSGAQPASNWARLIGGQPRSRPMRFIIWEYGPKNSSAARLALSAMYMCELMPTAGPLWPAVGCFGAVVGFGEPLLRGRVGIGVSRLLVPARSSASRYKSTSGAKRAGAPPMMAIISGKPSIPARATDAGVPPTAIHMGSGCCSGRGYMAASCRAARCRPDQLTLSESRSASSSSSFSANSSS